MPTGAVPWLTLGSAHISPGGCDSQINRIQLRARTGGLCSRADSRRAIADGWSPRKPGCKRVRSSCQAAAGAWKVQSAEGDRSGGSGMLPSCLEGARRQHDFGCIFAQQHACTAGLAQLLNAHAVGPMTNARRLRTATNSSVERDFITPLEYWTDHWSQWAGSSAAKPGGNSAKWEGRNNWQWKWRFDSRLPNNATARLNLFHPRAGIRPVPYIRQQTGPKLPSRALAL